MKILAIGDPHGNMQKLRKIPMKGTDLILLTGDLGKADLARKKFFENIERKKQGLPEIEDTPEFQKKVDDEIYYSSIKVLRYCAKFAPTYFIYGNVEPYAGTRPSKKRKTPWLPTEARKRRGVRIINNRVINFNGIRIGGLEYFTDVNWVQDFKPSDYKKRMKTAKKQTDKARRVLRWFNDVNILVCHQPPYELLDKVGSPAPKHWRGKHAGSKTILNYIKRNQPKYVFCGHIHESQGSKKLGKTKVYNLGVCGYKLINLNYSN